MKKRLSLSYSLFLFGSLLGFAVLSLSAAAQTSFGSDNPGGGPNSQSQTATADTSATGEWAWMGGSSSTYQHGVYGTLGTPAAGNNPGARFGAASWTDHSGNFWLFGGEGYDANPWYGELNDLWEFNPRTGEWTWQGGSSSLGYKFGLPGVYGTLGKPAAGNFPGSRMYASTWTDSGGNLWLFGGYGYGADGQTGPLNDVWEFSPFTLEWAWMGGSSTTFCYQSACGNPGVYGTLGTPAPGNIPGSREAATSWTDSSGHLWLFGGGTYGANWSFGAYNDIWEFDPSVNEWAWMGGSKTANQPGVYGTKGAAAAGNVPGGRLFAFSWTGSNGNLWLFGGEGIIANGKTPFLNDLWEFNPSTKEWAWIGGNSTTGSNCDQYGDCG